MCLAMWGGWDMGEGGCSHLSLKEGGRCFRGIRRPCNGARARTGGLVGDWRGRKAHWGRRGLVGWWGITRQGVPLGACCVLHFNHRHFCALRSSHADWSMCVLQPQRNHTAGAAQDGCMWLGGVQSPRC